MKLFFAATLILFTQFFSPKASAQFAGGAGTENDPWQVETIAHLNNLNDYLGEEYSNVFFIQVSDITDGAGFSGAIGTPSNPFMANYDGDNHTIANIVISMVLPYPDGGDQGVFGYVSDATIRNLHLENIDVAARSDVGGLVGQAYNSLFENITIQGDIASIGEPAFTSRVGGLAGAMYSCTAHNISTEVEVTGVMYAGAFAGLLQDETEVRYCRVEGSVTAEVTAGGFAGAVQGNSLVADSYSHAAVVSTGNNVGGFIGRLNSRNIFRSFCTGFVSGEGDRVGGFIGWRDIGGTVTHDCIWNTETSGQLMSSDGNDNAVGMTTADMQATSSYPRWNFMSAWEIDEGASYPYFSGFAQYADPVYFALSQLDGDGTTGSPYIVGDINQLNAVRQDLNASYVLAEDVSLLDAVKWNSGKGWEPIGTEDAPFTGSFDGADFTVSELSFNNPTRENQGLFGYIENAEIENLRIQNVHINGNDNTGSGVGFADNSIIENIYCSGIVVSFHNRVGGAIGNASSSEVREIWTDATVYGDAHVGGALGSAGNGSIVEKSFSLATVSGGIDGGSSAGGFVGSISGSETLLTNNYSRADVSGVGRVGGFAGSTNFGVFSNCYSTGSVSGISDQGGFLGYKFGQNAVNCYWDMDQSGLTNSEGGDDVHGKTTDQMTFPYEENTFVDWDFTTIWIDDVDSSQNDGYPYLIGTGPTVSVEQVTATPTVFSIYPNPATDQINISADAGLVGTGFTIYDQLGRVVSSGRVQAKLTSVDLTHLAGGVYLFVLDRPSNESIRFVKH